jgi:hypothetical protein
MIDWLKAEGSIRFFRKKAKRRSLMQGARKTSAWLTAGTPIAALVLLLIVGCASSGSTVALDWKQVDPSAFGNQKFNAAVIQTYGPTGQQLYGYFLCADGVTVSFSGRITGTPIGRMSLADVQQDYQRILRDNMMTMGGNLILREVLRNGSVVAYTATMPSLNVTTWDMAPGTPGPAVLQLTFP